MGLRYRYLQEDDLVVTVGTGAITADDLTAFARAQMEDPNWPFGARRIAELTTVTSRVSSDEVEDVAQLYGLAHPRRHGIRQAIVAPPRWDLAEVFERRIDELGMTTIVFGFLGVACSWLGLDTSVVAPLVNDLRAEVQAS